MTKDETETLFWLCFGVVAGILGFFRGFKIRSKRKLIENIPTSTVRGMAVGLVEAQGKAAVFRGLLRSQFAKADCVFYRYKVEEHQGSGKNSQWVTVAEYTSPEFFYLEDDTGKALVNPMNAELHLGTDRKFSTGFGAGDKDEFLMGLSDLGITARGFMGFEKNMRCSEIYILPGDFVYIMGTACPDIPSQGSAKGFENLCLRKEGDSFFCISDKSEKELLASLGGQMYLFLYGGPVLTVICLFILVGHYLKQMF